MMDGLISADSSLVLYAEIGRKSILDGIEDLRRRGEQPDDKKGTPAPAPFKEHNRGSEDLYS
jgi:hypothetical protein